MTNLTTTTASPCRRGRPAKSHDNTVTRQFVSNFWNATDMTQTYPATGDILAGVLALKTEGDSSTRSLSRTALFRVLTYSDRITVSDVRRLLGARYSDRAVQRYAEAARVASKALAAFISTLTLPPGSSRHPSRLADMQAIDAPYAGSLAVAEVQCIGSSARRGADMLQHPAASERTPSAILRRGGHADAA